MKLLLSDGLPTSSTSIGEEKKTDETQALIPQKKYLDPEKLMKEHIWMVIAVSGLATLAFGVIQELLIHNKCNEPLSTFFVYSGMPSDVAVATGIFDIIEVVAIVAMVIGLLVWWQQRSKNTNAFVEFLNQNNGAAENLAAYVIDQRSSNKAAQYAQLSQTAEANGLVKFLQGPSLPQVADKKEEEVTPAAASEKLIIGYFKGFLGALKQIIKEHSEERVDSLSGEKFPPNHFLIWSEALGHVERLWRDCKDAFSSDVRSQVDQLIKIEVTNHNQHNEQLKQYRIKSIRHMVEERNAALWSFWQTPESNPLKEEKHSGVITNPSVPNNSTPTNGGTNN